MSESVKSMKKEICIREASKDLAETQVEKLRNLAESVDFDNEEDFISKIATLKESYFGQKSTKPVDTPVEMVNETVEEEEIDETEISSNMSRYLSALRTQ
jgi:formate dehydrogenase maturation protein FdhE